MCNTRSITYSCGHAVPFRLSTCRGKFTYQTRKSPTGFFPSCRSGPLLTFTSIQICGACAKKNAEKDLEEKISQLRLQLTPDPDDWTAEPPEELVTAEAEFESEKWRLEKAYLEQSRFKKGERPEKGPPATRSESLLKREVKEEDVVVKLDVNKTAVIGGWDYESWGDGWTDLGQEIAENDAERVRANLPAFTDCSFDCPGEEVVEGEEQPEVEFLAVMDCKSAAALKPASILLANFEEGGDATTGVLQTGGDWDPYAQAASPSIDDAEGETSAQNVESEVVTGLTTENQRPACQEDQELQPNKEPQVMTNITKESFTPACNLWALHRRLHTPSTKAKVQEEAPTNDFEPFKACSPFFMEFAVSV